MGFFTALTTQLGILLKSQSTARRLMLMLIMGGAITAMAYLAFRTEVGGTTTLYQNLLPSDASEMMAKLRQNGIEAQIETGGTAIKVPARKADEAIILLSMEGLPGSGTVGYEQMDKSTIGQTKSQQDKNYQRMREGELARTLQSIREVERARVHLALPEDSLFIKSERPVTASVVLKLRAGAKLDERQVNGIVHLVAHSVEGLKGENVSIIDNGGNLLNQSRRDEATETNATQQSFKTQTEELLKSRIESMLEKVVGPGKVSARVQTDFDFQTLRQTKEIYNPDDQEKMLKSEKSMMESTARVGQSGVGGAPGSSSNMPGMMAAGQDKNSSASAEARPRRVETTSEYAVSKTIQESQQNAPTPQRISVAVLVDGNYELDNTVKGKPQQRFVRRSDEELAQLGKLVEATIGFSEKRQDVVTVECAQFKIDAPEDMKEPFLSYPMRQMIQLGVEWGIIGLLGLLLIFMVLRPAMKQILVTPAGGEYAALPGGVARGELFGRGGEGIKRLGNAEAAPSNVEELDDLPDAEVPEEMRGNQEAMRHYKLQRLAAKQARLTQVQAQKIQKEVVDTAKNNPQKTVSLLRQWIEEA